MVNTADLIAVPGFARLSDYLGLWAIEPQHFAGICRMAQVMDLRMHVEHGAEPLQSTLQKEPAGDGKSIAIIRLSGLLMKGQSSFGGTSTIQARRDIRQAANDPEVGGILLAIDSPGGTVAGTDDLGQEVKFARRRKEVWAHVDDMAASAAYWTASQADRIVVNSPTAVVGSIGTFQVIHDVSAAAEKEGIRTLVFKTGPLKGIGAPGAAVTDEQAAHVQALVDSVQTSFDAAVKSGRGLTERQLANVRHGGLFTASAAMDAKLIDGVQPLSKTLNEFTQSLKGQPRGIKAGVLPMARLGVPAMLTG